MVVFPIPGGPVIMTPRLSGMVPIPLDHDSSHVRRFLMSDEWPITSDSACGLYFSVHPSHPLAFSFSSTSSSTSSSSLQSLCIGIPSRSASLYFQLSVMGLPSLQVSPTYRIEPIRGTVTLTFPWSPFTVVILPDIQTEPDVFISTVPTVPTVPIINTLCQFY